MAALRACLMGLALLLALPLGAQEQRGLQRDGITVYYQPRDEQFARTALDGAVTALPVLEGALKLAPARPTERLPIRIDVVRTMQDFNRLVGAEMKPWTEAVALPGRHIVVQTLAPANMKVVIAHELTHVLLDEAAKQAGVEPPRWLHEGLAKYATDDFTQNDREILGQAVVERRLIPLAELEAAFAGDRDRVALAYAESYTLVRYLHELQPGGGLAQFLRDLALTGEVDRALLRTYGKPAGELEAEWMKQVQEQYLKHGLGLLSDSAIFTAMAVVFMGVYFVHRRRSRIIRERLQEDERLRRMFGEADDEAEPADLELPEDY